MLPLASAAIPGGAGVGRRSLRRVGCDGHTGPSPWPLLLCATGSNAVQSFSLCKGLLLLRLVKPLPARPPLCPLSPLPCLGAGRGTVGSGASWPEPPPLGPRGRAPSWGLLSLPHSGACPWHPGTKRCCFPSGQDEPRGAEGEGGREGGRGLCRSSLLPSRLLLPPPIPAWRLLLSSG